MQQYKVKKPKEFEIISRKFDGSFHKKWKCVLITMTNSLFIFRGVFDKEIKHQNLGVIGRGTISTEFFWLDRFYNIFKFETPDKNLIGFYCNFNLPPKISDSVVEFIDLDLDVFVKSNFSYEILDEDEFKENSIKYAYPENVLSAVEIARFELFEMIEKKIFPFDLTE